MGCSCGGGHVAQIRRSLAPASISIFFGKDNHDVSSLHRGPRCRGGLVRGHAPDGHGLRHESAVGGRRTHRQVTVYSAVANELGALAEDFAEDHPGIQLNLVRLTGSKLTTRIPERR